jgi:DNA-directed RNA polymerase specialized sigma24 family protein
MHSDEPDNWIADLQTGDCEALEAVWQQYYPKLLRVIRRRLGTLQLRGADEEDIALSAVNSLYAGLTEGRFPTLQDRHDLWKILLTIAYRKTNTYRDHYFAKKRGGGKQRGESVFDDPDLPTDARGIEQISAREPSPEFLAAVTDTLQSLLAQLTEPLLTEVVRYKMNGYTNDEIAVELGFTTRTVERKLERIRALWTDSCHSSTAPSVS